MDEFCRIEMKRKDVKYGALMKMYDQLAKHSVTVGIHKEDGGKVIGVSNGKPFTLIQNACIQEFGNTQTVQKSRRFKSPFTGKWFYLKKGAVITIPPRVFIRIFSTDKAKQRELTQVFKQSIELYKYAHPIYENVGDWARLVMKERILFKQVKPKNASMTVEYKGFNNPLYATGKLASAIKSEVH